MLREPAFFPTARSRGCLTEHQTLECRPGKEVTQHDRSDEDLTDRHLVHGVHGAIDQQPTTCDDQAVAGEHAVASLVSG